MLGRIDVDRAQAGHRRLQAQIKAQRLVVVEVLVAQRNPEHPLANQFHHAMTHLATLARVAEFRRDRRRQTQKTVGLAQ